MRAIHFSLILLAGMLAACQSTQERNDGELTPALQKEMNATLQRVPHLQGLALLEALRQLSAFGHYAVAPVSEQLLHAEDPRVRSNAIYVLGEIFRLDANQDAYRAILSAMNDPDRKVRLEAARTLFESGDRRGVGILVEALEDPERSVRIPAFIALASQVGRSMDYDPNGTPEHRMAGARRFREYFESVAREAGG